MHSRHGLGPVCQRGSRWPAFVLERRARCHLDNLSVFEADHPVGHIEVPVIVRHDDQCLALALSGWVGVPVLQTQLRIFDANRFAEGVPQVDDVGDDHAFALLRCKLLRQQTLANATFDA